MRSVIAWSLALVLAQFGLYLRKDLLLHNRRNGDRDPILRLALDVTRTPSERLQGGSTLTSCDLARPIGIRCASVGWIREQRMLAVVQRCLPVGVGIRAVLRRSVTW